MRVWRARNREANRAYQQAYNREYRRVNRHKLAMQKKAWAQSEAGRESMRKNSARMRGKYPEKVKARSRVSDAVRSGKLTKQPCEVCGSARVQAHHDDYSKPLEVRWLCRTHHNEEGK